MTLLVAILRSTNRWLSTKGYAIRRSVAHSSSDAAILLYHTHSRPRFVILITTAAGIQLLFWTYLSYSALEDYYTATLGRRGVAFNNDVGVASNGDVGVVSKGGSPGRDKVIEDRLEVLQSKSSLKWRLGFSLLALSVGAFFGITAVMYPRRMVNGLVFNRLTNTLSISTHNPIGGIHQSQVSIFDVQSTIRNPKSSHYAIKVKGHRLFYLVDKNGEFPNLKLFNTLIGNR